MANGKNVDSFSQQAKYREDYKINFQLGILKQGDNVVVIWSWTKEKQSLV